MSIFGLNGAVVSIAGGIVSIFVAGWNIYTKVVERREDKATKRPYLIVDSLQIAPALGVGSSMMDIFTTLKDMPQPFDTGKSEPAEIQVSIRNNGAHPASGITADIEMFCAADHAASCFPPLKFDSANPLPYSTQIPFKRLWSVPSTPGKQWIRVTLKYDDAMLGSKRKFASSVYYYEWSGVQSDEDRAFGAAAIWGDVVLLSAADRDCFERRLVNTSTIGSMKHHAASLSLGEQKA